MIRVKGQALDVRADLDDRPALLLVHGLLSSRNHWLLNQETLRKKYRLVFVELPGHGRAAPCTDHVRLHPDALADELDRARQILGIRRWHICGQSFAAGVTLRHALRHPNAVAAQIWTNGNRVLSEPPDPAEIVRIEARTRALETEGREALRREQFHPLFGRRFPPNIRERLVADADGSDLVTIAALLRHTLPALPMRAAFACTRVPTLLVNGTLESQFQPARVLATQLLPSLEVADLPGGHAINIEKPKLFDETVLEFISRHDHRLG